MDGVAKRTCRPGSFERKIVETPYVVIHGRENGAWEGSQAASASAAVVIFGALNLWGD